MPRPCQYAAPALSAVSSVVPLVSSIACKVVAMLLRRVSTCSRLGRPRVRVSWSSLTNDVLVSPRVVFPSAVLIMAESNGWAIFQGPSAGVPMMAAAVQPESSKVGSCHFSTVSRDQLQLASVPIDSQRS